MTQPTVKVPGAGNVKRSYLLVGGVAVVGIVGYAWISRSRTPTVPVDSTADTSLPDPTLPTVTTTTVPDNTDVISTNAQWTQHAVEFLSGQGVDGVFAATALGKFLARRGLTTQEQDVVLAALAAFGQPPTGGPYNVLSAGATGTPPPTAGKDYHYATQRHQIGSEETAWSLITRFSDAEVLSNDRLRYALKITVIDPRNLKYRAYYASHAGKYPAKADLFVHVVKKG